MGLDGIELLMTLEERFGVELPDKEMEGCETPSSLIDIIFGKLRATDEQVCQSQRGFYLLRRAVVETCGMGLRDVTPDLDLRTVIPPREQKERWMAMKAHVKARRWPEMSRSKWIKTPLALCSFAIFMALLSRNHWILGCLCGGAFGLVSESLTRPFRCLIPGRCATPRTLVPWVLTSDHVVWTRDQVAEVVRKNVIEVLGLKEGRYREDAHFVRDLGMD